MTFRRLALAAALLLMAVFWKLTFPPFSQELLPALREALGEEQVHVALPAELPAWLKRG